MDVRDLAPALLSIGHLCEKSNEIINGGGAEVAVRVRSDFKTGSFELSLDVTQKLIEAARYIFTRKDQIATANDLLGIIGFAGSAGINLIQFIKWLKGRKAEKTTTLDDGKIRIIVNNNIEINNNTGEVYIDVSRHVFDLYNDEEIRKSALGAIKPLEKVGIDTFAVKEDGKNVELITSEDLPYFNSLNEHTQDELLLENDRKAALVIVKPSFDKDLKWVFSEGEARFSALMQDQEFIKQLASREVTFGQGDILIVQLSSKSYQTATGIRIEHKIPKVLEVKPAPRQMSFLPPPTK